jgi:hypothetical protein
LPITVVGDGTGSILLVCSRASDDKECADIGSKTPQKVKSRHSGGPLSSVINI